jgi:hypothetical protein
MNQARRYEVPAVSNALDQECMRAVRAPTFSCGSALELELLHALLQKNKNKTKKKTRVYAGDVCPYTHGHLHDAAAAAEKQAIKDYRR